MKVIQNALSHLKTLSTSSVLTRMSRSAGGLAPRQQGSQKKIFVALCQNDIVVKVGSERAGEMTEDGSSRLFDPSEKSRPMKEWVHVDANPGDWLEIAEEAKVYVSLQAGD